MTQLETGNIDPRRRRRSGADQRFNNSVGLLVAPNAPGVSVPSAGSLRSRQADELLSFLGGAISATARIASIAGTNRRRAEVEMRGEGVREGAERDAELTDGILSGDIVVPDDADPVAFANSLIDQRFAGADGPLREGLERRLVPSLASAVVRRRRAIAGENQAESNQAIAESIAVAETPEEIAAGLDALRQTNPDASETTILTNGILPALKSAASVGDTERFERYAAALGGRLPLEVAEARATLRRTNQQHTTILRREESEALDGILFELERGTIDAATARERAGNATGDEALLRGFERAVSTLTENEQADAVRAASDALQAASLGGDEEAFAAAEERVRSVAGPDEADRLVAVNRERLNATMERTRRENAAAVQDQFYGLINDGKPRAGIALVEAAAEDGTISQETAYRLLGPYREQAERERIESEYRERADDLVAQTAAEFIDPTRPGNAETVRDRTVTLSDGSTRTITADDLRDAAYQRILDTDFGGANPIAMLLSGEAVDDEAINRQIVTLQDSGYTDPAIELAIGGAFAELAPGTPAENIPEHMVRALTVYQRLNRVNPALADRHAGGESLDVLRFADFLQSVGATTVGASGSFQSNRQAIAGAVRAEIGVNPDGSRRRVQIDDRLLEKAVKRLPNRVEKDPFAAELMSNLATRFKLAASGPVSDEQALAHARKVIDADWAAVNGRLFNTRAFGLSGESIEAVGDDLIDFYYRDAIAEQYDRSDLMLQPAGPDRVTITDSNGGAIPGVRPLTVEQVRALAGAAIARFEIETIVREAQRSRGGLNINNLNFSAFESDDPAIADILAFMRPDVTAESFAREAAARRERSRRAVEDFRDPQFDSRPVDTFRNRLDAL